MTESENLRNWFHAPTAGRDGTKPRRERLSLARWCNEIGYDPGNFNRYLAGKIELPEPHLSNMVTIAEGFGYKPLTNEHNFL